MKFVGRFCFWCLTMALEIPSSFHDYIERILGDRKDLFLSGLEFGKKTSIRINTLKTDKNTLKNILSHDGFVLSETDFADYVLMADEGNGLISKTLEHFLGLFYIQSVASMVPPVILDPQPGETILDISAAPGSKTTQIAQLMNNRGVIVANDWDGKRIKTLSHNLDRMGVVNAAMVNMGGERIGNLLPASFDKILVDAPCSALGVIHKAPQAVANIPMLQKFVFIQEQLLVSAIKAVKTGGTIVYSTCTVSPEENEKLINTLIGKYPLEIEEMILPKSLRWMEGLTQADKESFHSSLAKTVRLLPSEINPEGFFIAKLRKTGDVIVKNDKEPFHNKKIRFEFHNADDRNIRNMTGYFGERFGIDPEFWKPYLFVVKEDEILIASGEWLGKESMLNRIYTHRVGTRLARTRREGEWKLSTNFAQLCHPQITKNRIELTDIKEIETFVEAGTIRREFEIKQGGVVVFADGLPLGCGVMHQGNLKSQMPKSRKVIGVDFD